MENSSRDGNTRPPYLPPEKNLYAGKEATVRTGHGKMDLFKIGKGVCQGLVTLLIELLCRLQHAKSQAG